MTNVTLTNNSIANNIRITPNAAGTTLSINFTQAGEINTNSNVGAGAAIYKEKVGTDSRLRTLVAGDGITITENTNDLTFDVSLTTTDVTEGSNLYYTNERVDDRVAALLVAGTNVTLNYDDNSGSLTISAALGAVDLSANSINDLGDVVISGTPANNEVLAYDTASSKWINQTASEAGFATVATSGAYSDLSGTPTLATVATSGAYADLTGKPSLATVATSGAYADLSGKPTLATVATSGAYADLTGKPSLATVATSGSYTDLTNKPTTSNITEGTNLYFTNARARSAISATGDISYNSSTGVISYTAPAASVTSVNTQTGTVVLDTDDIGEGSTNLYYTNTRVGNYLSSNGYQTASAIVATITDSAPTTLDTLNELAAALGDDPNFATTVTTALGNKLNTTDFTTTANTWLGTKSTTNLAEGTNQYFTNGRARAAVSATDAGGDGSLTYSNLTGVFTYTGPSAAETRAHFSAGTGITITDGVIASSVTDTNTTYAISAETGAPNGANLRLTGSDASTDDVRFANGTNISVTRTNANTITIGTTGLATVATTGAYGDLSGTPTLPTVPEDLNDLLDVNAPSPSDGDVLTWDGTAGEWTNSPAGGGGGFDQNLNTTDSVEFVGLTVTGSTTTAGIVNTATQYSEAIFAKTTLGGTALEISYAKPTALADGDSTGMIEFSVDASDNYAYAGKIQGFYDSTIGNNLVLALYTDGINTFDENYPLELFPTEVKFLDGNAKIEYDSENGVTRLNSFSNTLEIISGSNVDIYAGEGSRILTKVNDVSVFELQETFAQFDVPVTFNDGVTGIALDGLDDVNAGAPADGDVLTWDDSAGEWVAAAPAGGGGGSFGSFAMLRSTITNQSLTLPQNTSTDLSTSWSEVYDPDGIVSVSTDSFTIGAAGTYLIEYDAADPAYTTYQVNANNQPTSTPEYIIHLHNSTTTTDIESWYSYKNSGANIASGNYSSINLGQAKMKQIVTQTGSNTYKLMYQTFNGSNLNSQSIRYTSDNGAVLKITKLN